MENRLGREVRLLKIYAAVLTLLCAAFLLSAFAAQNRRQRFEEIDVERINVVEKDGRVKLVISNKGRQTPVVVDGKTFGQAGERSPGLIFFNDKGDEVGGLIYNGNTGEGQYGSLTFDKFRGDQTVALQHKEGANGEYFAGLALNDVNLPTVELMSRVDAAKRLPDEAARNAALGEMRERGDFLVNRLLVGRGRDRSALMTLSDAKGRPRIRISVAADGNPRIAFLDESGKVTYSLPEAFKK
ncbi:MAG TPA: hypothetical protein VN282_25265 [Pyrinomonadaceae bacterium]|nr:hypothetical protein [Pyrinomonadaceae bacterium]